MLYARSYLLTLRIVGALGILLPLSLVVAEALLDGRVLARGSPSACYHTAARDVWVASLSVIGVLLVTYLSGQTDTRDFWLSLTALVDVFFPTARPGVVDTAPRCGTDPVPAGCVAIQQLLGESLVAGIHFAAAGVVVLALAALCSCSPSANTSTTTTSGWPGSCVAAGGRSSPPWLDRGRHGAGGADRPPDRALRGRGGRGGPSWQRDW